MYNLLSFLNLGGGEIFLIFAAILLLFGGKKIPELMRGIGKGVKEFNSAKANLQDEFEKGMKDEDVKSSDKTAQ
ncbi:MAG TPA: twin-arginine translocase TatA/TatE family subunit [Chitinophagales bacterium]|nr:twin-arginine translocase TatA/TatE family subunit [Chitinophagales bacterium]HNL84549.1 twin-arginine translocase TatA/TatE family subunit [Chitinophagales bacterium]